jgi:hypothetical protein
VVDCRELLQERQKLEEMIRSLDEDGEIAQHNDFKGGFAERKLKS